MKARLFLSRFELLTAVTNNFTVFWDVTSCSLMDTYQCFHLQGIYQTIWCHTSEDSNIADFVLSTVGTEAEVLLILHSTRRWMRAAWFKSPTLYGWEKSIWYSMGSQSESGHKLRNPCDVSIALTAKHHLLVRDASYIGGSLRTVWRNAMLPSSHRTLSWTEWIYLYHFFSWLVYIFTVMMDAACTLMCL
jgi:hypothetical protein